MLRGWWAGLESARGGCKGLKVTPRDEVRCPGCAAWDGVSSEAQRRGGWRNCLKLGSVTKLGSRTKGEERKR